MDYDLLTKQIQSLSDGVTWDVTLLSNISALLYEQMDRINWAGFYLMRNGELLLGPFQGKAACERIPVGKGVCGTAVKEDRVIRVGDVHCFPGHIACDSASASEIVLPIHVGGSVIGVLDIDSPEKERFSESDEEGLGRVTAFLEEFYKGISGSFII